MKKSFLLASSAMVLLILAGCVEEQDATVVDQKSCLAQFSAEDCARQYAEALAEHKKTAPVYASRALCEEAHGTTGPDGQPACESQTVFTTVNSDGETITLTEEEAKQAQTAGQPVTQNNGGSSPFFWYWLGTMNSNNSNAYAMHRPLYPSAGSTDLFTSNGYPVRNAAGAMPGTKFKVDPAAGKPTVAAGAKTPSRVVVTKPVGRGGFSAVAGRGIG